MMAAGGLMWHPPVTENMLRGYRPFHALDCWARILVQVDGNCTCGGLDEPLYRPGDDECLGPPTVPVSTT